MSTITWSLGTKGYYFETASNWVGGVVPGPSDTAVLPTESPLVYGVKADTAVTVAGLTIGAGVILQTGIGGDDAAPRPFTVTGSTSNAGEIEGATGGNQQFGVSPPQYGGDALYGSGYVTNTGTIVGGTGGNALHVVGHFYSGGGGGVGLHLDQGGTFVNHGSVMGGAGGLPYGANYSSVGGVGVYVSAGGLVDNFGAIVGGTGVGIDANGVGVYLRSGGTVVNHGVIGGLNSVNGAGDTVINYGTLLSVVTLFKATHGEFLVEPGSTVTSAYGGGGELAFAGAGETFSNIGSAYATISGVSTKGTFDAFGTYFVSAKATVTALNYQTIVSGKTVTVDGHLTLDANLLDQGLVEVAGGAIVGGVVTVSASGSLVALSGTNRVSTVDSAGAITVDNGAALTLSGGLAGSATIASSGAVTSLFVGAAGGTIGTKSVVTLSGSLARLLGAAAAAELQNAGTIKGQGFIGLGNLTLDNETGGVVEATTATGINLNTKGETLVNTGFIGSTTNSVMAIIDTTVANAGTIGVITSGRVDIQGSDIVGGTLKATGGAIYVTAGSELDGHAAAVSLIGVLVVPNGEGVTIDGSLADTGGQINVWGAAKTTSIVIGPDGATLSGGGAINLSPNATNAISAPTAATLTNVDNKITGGGTIGSASLTLVNEAKGSIVGTGTAILVLNTGANTISNAGVLQAGSSKGMVIESSVDNTGTLIALGSLTLQGAVTGAGTAVVNAGTLIAQQAFSENVSFGTTGELILADSRTYAGTISNFSKTKGTSLDLRDIAFATVKASYSGTTSSGTLTVTDGTHTAHIRLSGDYLGQTFILSKDATGGTIIVDPAALSAARFTSVAAALAAEPLPALTLTPETRRFTPPETSFARLAPPGG